MIFANTERKRIILATPIAETSLTIEGVSVVIDSGLMKKPYFSPQTVSVVCGPFPSPRHQPNSAVAGLAGWGQAVAIVYGQRQSTIQSLNFCPRKYLTPISALYFWRSCNGE